MGSVLAATTKAQVSGHKFLSRRIEHGVVLGDVRMIADPLGSRRRATVFGLIGTAIIAAGAGVLAIFSPAVDPGNASIIRVESGAMYVQLPGENGPALHPVANEASARLIVGKPEPAAEASLAVLDGKRRGIPVGIVGAPAVMAPHPQPAHQWSVVHAGDVVTVVAGNSPPRLDDAHGILARAQGRTWLITSQGRAELPGPETPLGRSIRRRLDITVDTPVWEPPPAVLSAVKELPPYRPVSGMVLRSSEEFWLEKSGSLTPLSSLQAAIAADLGLETREVKAQEVNDYPVAVRQVAELPLAPIQWQRPEHVWVLGDGRIALGGEVPVGIKVSGKSVAQEFSGPSVGAFGVDTGNGIVVVTDYGHVHRVASVADAEALGVIDPQPAPWPILALLPEGPELSRSQALKG